MNNIRNKIALSIACVFVTVASVIAMQYDYVRQNDWAMATCVLILSASLSVITTFLIILYFEDTDEVTTKDNEADSSSLYKRVVTGQDVVLSMFATGALNYNGLLSWFGWLHEWDKQVVIRRMCDQIARWNPDKETMDRWKKDNWKMKPKLAYKAIEMSDDISKSMVAVEKLDQSQIYETLAVVSSLYVEAHRYANRLLVDNALYVYDLDPRGKLMY